MVMAARGARTRISLRGEESTLAEPDGNASGSLLFMGILDGGSSNQGSFDGDTTGACDSGSHLSNDCGSHGGFDAVTHH